MVYLAAKQQNTLIQFPVCANIGRCAFHLRYSVTGLREAHPNSIFSLPISVLEYYTANNVMSCFGAYRCFLPLRHTARDPISVAFFDRVALFSDFNRLFELLDQILLPIAVVPFIYWNYVQKTF